MPIDERPYGDVTVLAPAGPLVVERFGELKQAVQRLVDAGDRRVVITLERVPYADSIGVSELIRAHMIVPAHGGHLTLARVPDRVLELLRITGLLAIFEIFESERDALDR